MRPIQACEKLLNIRNDFKPGYLNYTRKNCQTKVIHSIKILINKYLVKQNHCISKQQ